jgi:hypothetical protein
MAMARNNRHNTAFVVGSILGAVVGAGAALWKTPYTGEELRHKLTGAGAHDSTTTVGTQAPQATHAGERSIKDKVLSGVEKTLAPIVGVELGKTANGSGGASAAGVVADPNISVNASSVEEGQMLRRPYAWKGDQPAAPAAAQGSGSIGLSLDRVDADKWAAAYAGEGDTSAPAASTPTPAPKPTPASAPAASTPADAGTASAATANTASAGEGQMLRQTHTWKGDQSAASSASQGTERIGLSLDRVDADKWAAAYAGEGDTTATTTPESTGGAASGSNASPEAESAAQTGLGAKPAFLHDDGDLVRHPAADNSAPESNVAEVGTTSGNQATRPSTPVATEAASVDQLTAPQTDRVPDSLRQPTERSTHPFPKLGGLEKG